MISATHVVASLHPNAGGPSRTVVQLTNALAAHDDFVVTLMNQSFSGDPAMSSAEGVDRQQIESSSVLALKFGLPISDELKRMIRQRCPNLIHSHGLWTPVNHWASATARRHDIPLIIQPRGMLEPWALNHKAWKKKLALALFQSHDLKKASMFFATSSMEYENIRSLGFRQPVAIIPNGVLGGQVCELDTKPNLSKWRDGERVVLFLSRVHPKKGLFNLLKAWAIVKPHGWRLQIAGPNEDGHLAEVLSLARELGIDLMVDYLGSVDGKAKSQTYLKANLFVLPTFSENFGLVVAEALAHGLPVITTHGAPWSDLETYGCGWWIDISVDALVICLREAMALSDEERQEMGERGRDYVRRYNWDDIAQQTIDVYRWILRKQPQPDFVHTD